MKHNVTIDRLRGFCVLVVVCMHTLFFFPNVLTCLGRALWNGYYGVTAFFCTSGFLITTNVLKRYGRVADIDPYAFYVMRFGRIVPPLLFLLSALTLLSTTAIHYFKFPPPLTLKENLLNALTLRYNVYYQRRGSGRLVWSILWSLSIEEMFYLAYPWIAKAVRTTAWLVVVLVAVIVYALVHRLGPIQTIYAYFGCFYGIALGALSALAARRWSGRVSRATTWTMMAVGSALAVSTYAMVDVNIHYDLGLTLIALGAALILFASQCAPFVNTRPWSYDPFVYIGRLSFEVYLFHMAIYALLSTVIVPLYPGLVFAVALICVVAVSDVVGHFYAEPLNRWLRTVLLSVRTNR